MIGHERQRGSILPARTALAWRRKFRPQPHLSLAACNLFGGRHELERDRADFCRRKLFPVAAKQRTQKRRQQEQREAKGNPPGGTRRSRVYVRRKRFRPWKGDRVQGK